MSYLDVPLGLALVAIGAGSLLVFLATAAVLELIERWRR